MKLTWFGGTTIRIHIGGTIVVLDPDQAPQDIDPVELTSGADQIIPDFGHELPSLDLTTWRPRKPARLLDQTETPPGVLAFSTAPGTILIDAIGEPPLLLLRLPAPPLGRWADAAVIVIFGDAPTLESIAAYLLDTAPPRLIVLAGDDPAVDHAIAALRDRLDGTGLVALQPRMALEI